MEPAQIEQQLIAVLGLQRRPVPMIPTMSTPPAEIVYSPLF